MNTLRAGAAPPDSVMRAIQRMIDDVNASDLPILDVSASAARLAASLPEAADIGVERLREVIAWTASRDRRVGLSIA